MKAGPANLDQIDRPVATAAINEAVDRAETIFDLTCHLFPVEAGNPLFVQDK